MSPTLGNRSNQAQLTRRYNVQLLLQVEASPPLQAGRMREVDFTRIFLMTTKKLLTLVKKSTNRVAMKVWTRPIRIEVEEEAVGKDGPVLRAIGMNQWMILQRIREQNPQSQLGAAEHERECSQPLSPSNVADQRVGQAVVSNQEKSSMLEPEISVTGPGGEKLLQKKTGVQPPNAFDHSVSAATSLASTSDGDPELADITKARKLGINVSAIDQTVPDRVMQVILRGDWAALQEEANEGRRRQRSYIVATDLSDEAVYALEWTIGTILRDGDTLLALYAIEDESLPSSGSGSSKGPQDHSHESLQAEGMRAARDAERTMHSLTKKTEQSSKTSSPNALTPIIPVSSQMFHPATETESVAGSVDARRVSKAQMERLRACDNLRTTCLKLVRRTRLQVRIMVEVIHAKSPKHLITGAVSAGIYSSSFCMFYVAQLLTGTLRSTNLNPLWLSLVHVVAQLSRGPYSAACPITS